MWCVIKIYSNNIVRVSENSNYPSINQHIQAIPNAARSRATMYYKNL